MNFQYNRSLKVIGSQFTINYSSRKLPVTTAFATDRTGPGTLVFRYSYRLIEIFR